MKVGLIHTHYKTKGGMEACLFNVIRGLLDAGDEIDLFVQRVFPDAPALDGVTVHEIPITRLLPRRHRRFAFFRRLRRHFDPGAYDLSMSFSRSTGQDITVCGGTHMGFLKSRGLRSKYYDCVEVEAEQSSYDNARCVVAHSGLLKTELIELYGIPEERIRVILPPVDLSKFSHRSHLNLDELALQLGVDRSKRILLFPSSGHTRKGFYELIDAAERLDPKKYQVLVAGDTAFEAKKLPNVRYLGFVDNLEEYLALSDFMILPSHYEPFGLVVPEALACGTPVILSRHVGASCHVADGHGVQVEHVSADGILAAIEEAFSRDFVVEEGAVNDWGLSVSDHVASLRSLAGASV